MAKFRFEAKTAAGKDFRGEIEAASEADARVKIRAQRMVPLRVVQASGGGVKKNAGGGRIKSKELQIVTRQLSTLLASGIPIMQALESLSTGTRNQIVVKTLQQVAADISQGKRLGDAFAEHPLIFDRFYVNMVRAGEESGNLDQILVRLATYIEKSVKLQGKVKGALVYPGVILTIAFVIVAGLLIFVIPKFKDLFSQFGADLPELTKMVVAMSEFFVQKWYIILGSIFGIGYGSLAYYRTPAGKDMFDTVMIDAPLFGELIQKSAVARFSRTLSTLLSSGVGIMEALEISSKTVGNIVIERAVIRARDSIAEGKSLIIPLQKEKYIPTMVTQMIGVGEQTGALDQMLSRIADFYEDEVDVAVSAMTQIIEPLLMVVLGSIVAFIVIAMYLPIFNLAGAVGG